MVLSGLAVILLDQASKLVIIRNLRLHESVPVITGFFDLVHIRNRGLAFGLMSRSNTDLVYYLLLAAGLGAVVILLLWFLRLKEEDNLTALGLSLILGGAIGNMLDRLRFREVIDFLDFYIGSYHWPAFNLADSAITTGTFLLVTGIIFQPKKKRES